MFLFVNVLQHSQTCTSTAVHCKPVCCTSLCCISKALLTIHSLFQSSFTEIYVSSKQAKSHCVLSSKHLFVHRAQFTVLQRQPLNTADHKTTHKCCSPHPIRLCHIHAAICVIVHVFVNAADGLET